MNNADTSEMYGVLLSWLWGLFVTTATDCPASYKAAGYRSTLRISADCNRCI